MRIRQSVLSGVARQLARPDGLTGQAVGWFLNRGNARVIAAAVAAARAEPGQDVADVGFGGGHGLARLLEATGEHGTVYGFEIAPTMLARARRSFPRQVAAGRLRLAAAAMDRLPLPDASLHAVISTNTVYFVEDLPAAFAELARVLRPGGRAVLGVGDPAAMARLPFTRYGFRLRPISEVTGCLRDAGFDVTDQRAGSGVLASHLLVSQKTTPATKDRGVSDHRELRTTRAGRRTRQGLDRGGGRHGRLRRPRHRRAGDVAEPAGSPLFRGLHGRARAHAV